VSLEPLLLTRRQAASYLSLSLRSVDYLLQQKRLNARRVGKRVLIPRAECERFARTDQKQSIVPVQTRGRR
jgi:excisionase family DNA binding protein